MNFYADMGGTEIKAALQHISENLLDRELCNRIFIMTVWDVNDCLNLVEKAYINQRYDTKFYSLGISNGCSESLVRRLKKVVGNVN